MRLMKILLLCLVTFLMQGHGFSEDTLVYDTEQHLVPINSIPNNSQISTYKPLLDTWMSGTVHDTTSFRCTVVVKITVGEHTIITAPEQLFLCIVNGVLLWKQAADVSPGDCLQSMHGPKRVASAHVISLDQPMCMHSISVFPTHTFCITEDGIVVHNIFLESGAACINSTPLFLESASLFSGGIAITPAGAIFLGGAAIAGVTYGVVRLVRYFLKKEPVVVQVSEYTTCPAPAHPVVMHSEQSGNNQPSSKIPTPEPPLPQPNGPPEPNHDSDSLKNQALRILQQSAALRELEQQVEKLADMVDNNKPGKILFGEVSNQKIYQVLEQAEKLWQQARMSVTDVDMISKSTGICREIIQKVKDHLFHAIHIKKYEIGTFDSDEDIIAAWNRLLEGIFVRADLELLKHEFAESILMEGQKMDYDTAHAIVNTMYDWNKDFLG